MKLKKIASLMLAGIMAVSMLAGCKDGASSNTSDKPEVDPVDNSFAASVNAELSDAEKATVTLSGDAEVAAALRSIASSAEFSSVITNSNWLTQNGSVAERFRDMLDLDADDALTAPTFFANSNDKKTSADLLKFDGKLTDEGLAEEVAAEVKALLANNYFPVSGTNNSKDYKYTYTGTVEVVDVTYGVENYYIVALTFTQTPIEIVQ